MAFVVFACRLRSAANDTPGLANTRAASDARWLQLGMLPRYPENPVPLGFEAEARGSLLRVPSAKVGALPGVVDLPITARGQTPNGLAHRAKTTALFNQLVSPEKKGKGHLKPQRSGGPKVDKHLDLGWLLNREIGGIGALDEAAFRKVVLVLPFASGLALPSKTRLLSINLE